MFDSRASLSHTLGAGLCPHTRLSSQTLQALPHSRATDARTRTLVWRLSGLDLPADPEEFTVPKTDPRVDKRRVTMRSSFLDSVDSDGNDVYSTHEAVDYVRPDFLEAYVADAKSRWQVVTVSEEPDAGPGGYNGATHVPAGLDHPLAGQTFAATEG